MAMVKFVVVLLINTVLPLRKCVSRGWALVPDDIRPALYHGMVAVVFALDPISPQRKQIIIRLQQHIIL